MKKHILYLLCTMFMVGIFLSCQKSRQIDASLDSLKQTYRNTVLSNPFPWKETNGKVVLRVANDKERYSLTIEQREHDACAYLASYDPDRTAWANPENEAWYIDGKKYMYSSGDEHIACEIMEFPYLETYNNLLETVQMWLQNLPLDDGLVEWMTDRQLQEKQRQYMACSPVDNVPYTPP